MYLLFPLKGEVWGRVNQMGVKEHINPIGNRGGGGVTGDGGGDGVRIKGEGFIKSRDTCTQCCWGRIVTNLILTNP